MKRQDVLDSSAMPLATPSYGRPPFRLSGRAALTVDYGTDAAMLRDALPEPLEPAGARVSVSFIDVSESPFGAYCACAISLAATLSGRPVQYCHALYVDQPGPIFAGREVWGLPATPGAPELILGENRVAGVLEFGYGAQLRASIPVAEPAQAAVPEPARAACKLIPGVEGSPAVAQLITVQPAQVTVKQCWRGAARLEIDPDSPANMLPILDVQSGQYVLGDMSLPYGKVAYDYLAAKAAGSDR